ncbi:MAG TPA: DALR domain-containing protein, partial [Rhodothermia bacterium]|nr:DALR domain-containing protein [Rhodothermia bacterium]
FDLHAGGEDLIFPHHECEIAQAESLTNKPLATHWIHTRFLQVEGKKMSKSQGNYLVPAQLMAPVADGGQGIDPAALRLALMSGYYRKPYNFTMKHLRDCAGIVARYRRLAERAQSAKGVAANGSGHIAGALDASYEACLNAMLDDLNTPKSLAAALEGVKAVERAKTLSPADAEKILDWLSKIDQLLGFVLGAEATESVDGEGTDDLAETIGALVEERSNARSRKDWARADQIRAELDALGVEIQDSVEGTTWRRK